MVKTLLAAAMMTASCCALAVPATATTVVTTPNANATTPGNKNVNSPFGAASTSNIYVLQVQYAASLFSSVEIGSQLTSIGFRLALGGTTNSETLLYDDFSVQIGTGANAIGGLSRTFASNLGSDTILARSGALSIAKNAIPADACTSRRCNPKVPVNSFFTIDLTTPYTYTGGDLLVTFSSRLAASTIGQIVPLDAVDPYAVSTVSTVGTSASGTTPTRGTGVNFSYAPILQFAFAPPPPAPVPEPASWAMMLGGFGLLGASMRCRRRTTLRFG